MIIIVNYYHHHHCTERRGRVSKTHHHCEDPRIQCCVPAAQTVQVNGVIRGSRSLSTEEIGIVLVNLWHDAGCSSTYVFFVVYDEGQAITSRLDVGD